MKTNPSCFLESLILRRVLESLLWQKWKSLKFYSFIIFFIFSVKEACIVQSILIPIHFLYAYECDVMVDILGDRILVFLNGPELLNK